jgi:tetratricopeptide (TPR) repeat protein
MLRTIEQYDQQHPEDKPVHKGLALHNLGIALYNLGQLDEAKRALERAYEEDQRTFGLENAKKGLAKKALETLAFQE